MHDYSQSEQDKWVLSIIKHKGYFVDLGAYDGRSFSNTLRLEEAGWKGLCVEPNPKNFELLKQNRKCKLVNMAVSLHTGELGMSDEGSSSYANLYDIHSRLNGQVLVSCDLIKNILKDNKVPKYIDYISSDLERSDASIWETFPFDEYSFGLATVEHVLYEGSDRYKNRIMKVMLENGYVLARENVECDGNAFEDWYASPKLIS